MTIDRIDGLMTIEYRIRKYPMSRVRKEVQMNQRETVSEKTILGIDLGTSSVKVMLLDPQSGVLGTAAREYGVDIPTFGYAEQRPETWWAMTVEALRRMK